MINRLRSKFFLGYCYLLHILQHLRGKINLRTARCEQAQIVVLNSGA